LKLAFAWVLTSGSFPYGARYGAFLSVGCQLALLAGLRRGAISSRMQMLITQHALKRSASAVSASAIGSTTFCATATS